MKRHHGDASSSSVPLSSSSQQAVAGTLQEDGNLPLKATQDKPISVGARLVAAKDKLREFKDALTSARAYVSKQVDKDLKLKNELANLYIELLEAKGTESDDRKQQQYLEVGAKNEKRFGNEDGVQNEAFDTTLPMTCNRKVVESENKRGQYGAKEDGKENYVVDAMMKPPSPILCEPDKVKESIITTLPAPEEFSDEPPVPQRRSQLWMALTDVYVSTSNADKIAELVEVQAAQAGYGNQLKQQDPPLSWDKDWDNDDSWRILNPLDVGNEALAVEMLGITRSYDDCNYLKNFFSVHTHYGGITHEKRWDTDAIMCPFELNGVCNDDGCQYIHSDTSRNNGRWFKRAHVLHELSLPKLIPFSGLISKPVAATMTPLEAQLAPEHNPLMDQHDTSVSDEMFNESLNNGFVPLGPNTDDEESEDDYNSENVARVTAVAEEEGSMDWPGGDVRSRVTDRHFSSSRGDGDGEIVSSEHLFTVGIVNIHPCVIAFSRSICAPSITEHRLCDVRYWEWSQNVNSRGKPCLHVLSSKELSILEAYLVAHPQKSSELWLLYVLHLLPRAQGADSPGAVLRAAIVANPTLFRSSSLVPGSLNPALRALARALSHTSNTSCEALWVLYLGLKESCTPTTEKSQHIFIQLYSHALQAIPLSPRIWAMRLDFVRQHCGVLSLFSALQEAYNVLRDIQACNISASIVPMYMFLVMYTAHSMLKSGRRNAAAAFLCSILNVKAEREEGDIEMNIDVFRPIEIALHISSATSKQRALLWITLAHVLAFGSIPRSADSLAMLLHVNQQNHERVNIDFLFSLLKWERGLLKSKAFPRLRRLPHLLALLRKVLCISVCDAFSIVDENGSGIACSTDDANNSPAYCFSVESFLPQSIEFDSPPVYKSVIITNLLNLEMGLDSTREPDSYLSTIVSRSMKLVEKACSKTGLMMDVVHVICGYITDVNMNKKLVKLLLPFITNGNNARAMEFVLMTTVQSSSNKKDTAMKALAIFLGESSGNFPDDNNLNSVFSDRFSHWTDSGFRQESEAELRLLLAYVRMLEGLKSAISRLLHMVTASGFSNMDPALRRLIWLCVLELCVENCDHDGSEEETAASVTAVSSRGSTMNTMEGDYDNVDDEQRPAMFRATTEEKQDNTSRGTTTAHLLASSDPLRIRLDPTLVVLRALDPSELILSPSFSPECTTIEQSVLTTIGASHSPSHFELETYICRILIEYIRHRKDNINWEFVDTLVSDEGGDTVDHSGDGGNALRVAPLSSLLLSQWILRAQTHQRSLSLAQVKLLCTVAIGYSRKGTTECSVLSRVVAATAAQLGDYKAVQHILCTSLKYEPSDAGLWEQLAWIQARYAPLHALKIQGRAVGMGASDAGVVVNLKCKGDGPLKTEVASVSLRQMLCCSSSTSGGSHCNPPSSSLSLASSLVIPSVPCSILLLTGLQKLSLAGNALVSLPEGMERFSHLRILDISNNSLKSLPLCIWSLSSLEALRMGKNLFTSLPNEAKKLQNTLIELDLSGNSGLGEIPQVVLSLNNLQTLKVRCCGIVSRGIPLDLARHLPVLCELDIGDNPCLPKAAV